MRTHHALLRRSTAFLAALAAIVVACGGQGGPLSNDRESIDGDWLLVEGTGPDGEVELLEDYAVTLSIADDVWGGIAACNNYGATVAVDGNDLRITELYQTEMACLDEAAMASEAAYLAAFGRVTNVELDGGFLVLTDDDGATTLRYEQVPEVEAAPVGGTA